ncbi:DgyrCDS7880 [Dimorphilus gyrociliatus]|uniref:DgyrCDS7880 n=1 Tax=Dimorphilus gyrociliatus TaxID=2664684 RepID=A0A7I8VSG0_9ANNE|nr:DgyrCDS7880 [Dimorphilus gyrociliatus]
MAYISLPLKKTWEVDFEKPLRQFISQTFENIQESDYKSPLQDLNRLRQNVVSKWNDKHESALEVLYRYYDQLKAIEAKFPIAENSVRINFKWQDAFDKESLFSGKKTLTIASARYEQACILYNIAALQSQIAACQNISSEDGLKTAAKFYQQSAGILNYLKDNILSMLQRDPTLDINPDSLLTLSNIMLAQAQDVILAKATDNKMKPKALAKLCMQASDLYAEALRMLQLPSLRDMWNKDWINSVAGKQAGFHSLAEYYQSQVAKENREYGEELSRLKQAKSLMMASESRAGAGLFPFGSDYQRISKALKDAEKDNDFIYHARIPDHGNLVTIERAAVAKPTLFNDCDKLSERFSDLFEKIVPLAVHQGIVVFEQKKDTIVHAEVSKLREATNTLNGIMASMNLPAALEDSGGSKLPQSVSEKSAKVRSEGGISGLVNQMNELPKLLTRNNELLEESVRMLDEEAQSDKQLREQFKEKWNRTPSEQLTKPLRQEADKYRLIIDNAITADKTVRGKLARYERAIGLLSKSDAEITKELPAGGSMSLKDSPVVNEVRQLCSKVETLKAERQAIEAELKEGRSDIVDQFTRALAEDGAINVESLSDSQLEKIYSELRNQVEASIRDQERIVADLQRVYSSAGSGNAGSREEMLKELAAGFDLFVELKGNLVEGTKFYNDLTELLVKFQSKISDLCFARRTEKEDLMADVQRNIIQRPTSANPPVQPSYQTPTSVGGESKPQAPARPPPPKFQAPKPPTRPIPPLPTETTTPPEIKPRRKPPPPPVPAARGGEGMPPASSQPPPPQYPNQPTAPPTAQPGAVPPYGYQVGYVPMPMPGGYNPYYQPPPQQQQQQPPSSGYLPYPTYPPHQ